MSDYERVEAVKRKVTKDIQIMYQKMYIIEEAKTTNSAVVQQKKIDILNQSINSIADPKILALVLEGYSRTESREIDPNDRFKPFVIKDEAAFKDLFKIISEKQTRHEPFRFDFLYLGQEHATPVRIISDGSGSKPDLFNVDPYGMNIFNNLGEFTDLITSYFNVHSYSSGEIQIGSKNECGVFAIQNLIHGNISNLAPKDHLDNFTIGVFDSKTREVKKQNRAFDKEYLKYLSEVQNLIDNKSPQEIIDIINKRLTPSEEMNAYSVEYLAVAAENIEKATEDIQLVSDCAGIKGVITKFLPTDRHLLINEVLINKIKSIIDNSSLSTNIVNEISATVRLFPENTRGHFLLPTIKLLSKVNSLNDVGDLIKCFSELDRREFIEPLKELVSRVNSPEGGADLIECFSESDRREFLQSVKVLLSQTSEPKALLDIIQYDNSLVQDVQEPLRKAISNGKMTSSFIFDAMINASPESERHHFLDNIKLYVNNLIDINDKAAQLSVLAKHLPDDDQEKLYEDVSKLMNNDKLSQENQDQLKSRFKNIYLAVVAENIEKAITDIEGLSGLSEIENVIRNFSTMDRFSLINEVLINKINSIIDNSSSSTNIVNEISATVRLFPQNIRGCFLLPTIKLLSKVNSPEGVGDLIKCFRESDRRELIEPLKKLVSRANSPKGVGDLIKCFREDDRGEFLPSVKSVLSKTSEANGLAEIIQYDNSLVQDVQEPLRKAISNGKMFFVNFPSMLKASPESEHHHFLNNIKLYVNNFIDINNKAVQLSVLARYLSDNVKAELHGDVSKLMNNDKLTQTSRNSLKYYFKNIYLAAVAKNIDKAITDIEGLSGLSEIENVITNFSPMDRSSLINDVLINKINSIIDNSSSSTNIVNEISATVRLFPQNTRSNFLLPTIKLLSKVNSPEGVGDLIKCFREDDRGEFLPSVKSVLSKTSEASGLAEIIQYDNSLVQDVQEPLRKAISNGKMVFVNFLSILNASPESERHHFLDNIKLYVNNLIDINDKAALLFALARHLPDDVKEKLYEDVSKLMNNDKLSQRNQDRLKSRFKNFDFDSCKKPEGVIIGSVSEAKDVAPPPPLPRPKEGGEGKNL